MERVLIHKGSTKDVYKTADAYLFQFSDRYSVFDWGEMPDQIPGKGKALAAFALKVYRHLEGKGVRTHLLDRQVEPGQMWIRPFEVIRNQKVMPKKGNIFIPLEVIFRLGVASGASLLKRFKTDEDWKHAGFDRQYRELEKFPEPKIEFTTKLERFDRPLTHVEAQELANLSDEEWSSLLTITKTIALEMKALMEPHGIDVWDGKVEFALGADREIILVDTIGPDELRLTKDGVQLSKEIIRQYYRQTLWYKELDEVKTQYGPRFKDFISAPETLPKDFLAAISEFYALLPEIILNDHPSATAELELLLPRLKWRNG